MSTRILACSSSKAGNSAYLGPVVLLASAFLGAAPLQIAFIPFASVGDYDDYAEKVIEGFKSLPHTITLVQSENAAAVIEKADVIMVGGGNTFKLLHDIYAYKLLDIIRDKVSNGRPYIGWSAGANITGPTIGTTNDMPIIEPKSFNALGLLPFQLNPHYINQKPEGHNGETRDQRLEEFLKMNPGISIMGLPEGSALQLEGSTLNLVGDASATLFSMEEGIIVRKEIRVGEDVSYLM